MGNFGFAGHRNIGLGQKTMAGSIPVAVASDQPPIEVSVSNTPVLIPVFFTRSDTFITTTAGIIVNVTTSPCSVFSLQVKATGVVTSWTVVLEVSLNGTDFNTILTSSGNLMDVDGLLFTTGSNQYPVLYFRSKCTAVSLGAGTNIVVTILGQN